MIRLEACRCKLDEFDHVENTFLDPYSQSTGTGILKLSIRDKLSNPNQKLYTTKEKK